MQFELKQLNNSPNWYVTWSEGGRSKRVSTRTSDSVRAKHFLTAWIKQYRPAEKAIWDLCDVLDWYYDDHAMHLESADDAKASVNRFINFYGAADPCSIDLAEQKRYIAHRALDGVGNETINRDLSVLAAALNRAYDQKKITERPYKVYLLPRAEPRGRYLTRTELALGYAYMWWRIKELKRYQHVLLFTRLAINTGARMSAILQLTWDRVDFKARKIWFPVPGRRQTKKRRTVIDFDCKLEAALRQAYNRRRTDYVIEFEGQPVKQIRKSVVKSFEAVGVYDVSPHTLRHTFGTWASGGGAHLAHIGGAMGHSNPSTTAKYAKYQPGVFGDVLRATRRKIR